MKFLAGIFIVLLAISAPARERITAVTIEGVSYVHVESVRVAPGGRIVVLDSKGGVTVTPDQLPDGFLASWGIKPEDIAKSKADAEKQAEQSLANAVRAGYFRQIDGTIYDLRKPQPGWRHFTDAVVVQLVDGGTLINPAPDQYVPTAVFVRNLPNARRVNQKISFTAKPVGEVSYVSRYGFETVHAYDAGRVCQRNEIPDLVLTGKLASAQSPNAAPVKRQTRGGLPVPLGSGLRGIGSGFFITRDGYLLTNFHVVEDADRVEVRYKSRVLKAKVVEVDTDNDLALLKVAGDDFPALSISSKDSADLGDEVFTIGFPNIDMQGLQPKYTDGKISSLAGMRDDPSEYQISVPVQPGNSGGPLCDVATGEVVGVVVARLNDLAALRDSGAVPQNVNYAVKAKHALRLVRNIKDLDLIPTVADSKPTKPVQMVENAVAMIMVY